MSERLAVEVVRSDEQVVIQARGEVDIATMGALRDSIEPFLGPNQTIVLDLSQLTFADSALLKVLVHARGELTQHGGSLLLRNPSKVARRLLTITELDDMIQDEVDRQNEDPA